MSERIIALNMKFYKLGEYPVCGPIAYSELCKDYHLVEGWCRVDNSNWFWHLWCENDRGDVKDVIQSHVCLEYPHFENAKTERVKELPEGSTAPDEDSMNKQMYETYKRSPKEFWKVCIKSHSVDRFRKRCRLQLKV